MSQTVLPEFSLNDVKVGDEILVLNAFDVEQAQRRGNPAPEPKWYPVEKVGRELLHVRIVGWGKPCPIDRTTGRERIGLNGNSTYANRAFTAEGWAMYKRRETARERVNATMKRNPFAWQSGLTTYQLERIADILEEDR